DAAHGERARIGMAKDMEGRGGFDLGAGAGGLQGALLVRRPPALAIVADEHELAASAASSQFCKEGAALVCQHDVARFARLALAHGYGSDLGVEVGGAHPGQL